MTDRLYLNAKQIEMFRNMYTPPHHSRGSHGNYGGDEAELVQITPNVRALQPLNNRTILASFAPFSRIEGPIDVGSTGLQNAASSSWRFALCPWLLAAACMFLS